MLQYNEIRMTPDTKHLIVDVSVIDMSYYENVYVGAISIAYIDKEGKQVVLPNFEYSTLNGKIPEGTKRFRIYADIDSIAYNMFIVTSVAEGEPAEDTPCGMNNREIKKAVFNTCPIYLNLMSGLRNLGDDCNPPQALMNQFFRYKAFQLAVETGDYDSAIKYWNLFFNKKTKKNSKGCGCHGR